MKRIFLFLILSLLTAGLFAKDLRKLSPAQREKELIKVAQAAIMRHGPDYYKELKPEIVRRTAAKDEIEYYEYIMAKDSEKDELFAHKWKWVPESMKGRYFYCVKYPHVETEELYYDSNSVGVQIWEDTGVAFRISFGSRYIPNIDEQSEKKGNITVLKLRRMKRVEEEYIKDGEKRVRVGMVPVDGE